MRKLVWGAVVAILALVCGSVSGVVAYGVSAGAWIALTLDQDISPQVSDMVEGGNMLIGCLAFVVGLLFALNRALPQDTQTKARNPYYR